MLSWIPSAKYEGGLPSRRAFRSPRLKKERSAHVSDGSSFVEQLRIGEAERRLATRRTSIDSIAASVGFKSTEVFRRAFERRHGQTPSRFQRESRRNAKKLAGDSRDPSANK